jgi:hypothetical protein
MHPPSRHVLLPFVRSAGCTPNTSGPLVPEVGWRESELQGHTLLLRFCYEPCTQRMGKPLAQRESDFAFVCRR